MPAPWGQCAPSAAQGFDTEAVPGLLYCDKPLPHQLRLPPALKAMLRQWRNLVAMAWRDHPA